MLAVRRSSAKRAWGPRFEVSSHFLRLDFWIWQGILSWILSGILVDFHSLFFLQLEVQLEDCVGCVSWRLACMRRWAKG